MATDSQPNDVPKGITADGTAPKRRIDCVSGAQTVYQTMALAYQNGGRDVRHAMIAGLFAGFPPVPPSEMVNMGLGDMPNANYRQFEARVCGYCDVWNSVNTSGSGWIEVKAEHPDPMEAERRGKVLSAAANWALGVWDDPAGNGFFNQSGKYVLNSAIRDTQMALFGIGICIWRDHIDFRPIPIPTRNVKVPDDTKLTLENCPFICIEDDMSASQLWNLREQKGWSEDQIVKLLYLNQGSGAGWQDAGTRSTYAQWVEWTRENESYMQQQFYPVPFVHIFTQEFSGKISHLCFSPTQSGAPQPRTDYPDFPKDDVFLYDAPEDKWVSGWPQALAVFSDNVGPEGRFHGVKGFGDRNFDSCNMLNTTLNKAAMAGIAGSTPIFDSANEADRDKLNQVTITPFGILTPGLQISQFKIDVRPQDLLAVAEMVDRVSNVNNRKYPVGERNQSGEMRTATEVQSDTSKEAEFTSLQIANYRSTGLDPTLSEQYRRLAQPASKYPESWPGGKVAKRFREKCEEGGIPEADFLKVSVVRASRNGGTGSRAMDAQIASQLMTVATPGKGQYNARYEMACALKGVEMAAAFVEPPPQQPNETARQIFEENLRIEAGQADLALPNDPHDLHVPAHIQKGSELGQVATMLMDQGVTPQNLDDAILLQQKLAACVDHTGQHLNFMGELRPPNGGKSIYEEMLKASAKALNSIQQLANGLEQDIQKAAEEQQQPQGGQQMSMEMMKAQVDAQVKMYMAEVDAQIAKMKAEVKLQTSQATTEMKMQQKIEDHQLKAGITAHEKTAELQQKEVQAAQDMQIGAAHAAQELQIKAASGMLDIARQAADTDAAEKKAKETK